MAGGENTTATEVPAAAGVAEIIVAAPAPLAVVAVPVAHVAVPADELSGPLAITVYVYEAFAGTPPNVQM